MSDLAEWLLVQIAEDEAVARAATRWSEGAAEWGDAGEPDWQHIARWDPARVLADCAAKRRIVTEVHRRAGDGPRARHLSDWQKDACEGCGSGGPCDDYRVEHINDCPTLRLLALPYVDRHGYDPAWGVA